jgi:hypothetical protein
MSGSPDWITPGGGALPVTKMHARHEDNVEKKKNLGCERAGDPELFDKDATTTTKHFIPKQVGVG